MNNLSYKPYCYELVKLQKKFKDLYQGGALIGVSEDSIHVTPQFFFKIFSDFSCKETNIGPTKKVVGKYSDIKFIALLDVSEQEKYKDKLPDSEEA